MRDIHFVILAIVIIVIGAAAFIAYNEYTKPVACLTDIKLCPDGTSVSRYHNCSFKPCPEIQFCDADIRCPEGYDCYKFSDEKTPICYSGNPCKKCQTMQCNILESYPMQIVCL